VPCAPKYIFPWKRCLDGLVADAKKKKVTRDVRERGRDIEGCIKQWISYVKPNFGRYVQPQREVAGMSTTMWNAGTQTKARAYRHHNSPWCREPRSHRHGGKAHPANSR